MLAVKEKSINSSIYITKYIEFNEDGVSVGKQKFNEYKQKGIILNNSFSDNIWVITNEVLSKEFKFIIPQTLFESERKSNRHLGTFDDFVKVIKVYFVLELATTALDSLHKRFNAFKKVLEYTRFFNPTSTGEDVIKGRKRLNRLNLQLLQTCLEILDFYPIPDTEELQEIYETTYQEIREEITTNDRNKGLNQRPLAEFQSLFYFDKLLNQFWEYDATIEEKAFYYPIYLWWKITNILPLRPTEFVLTPFDCLDKNDKGENILFVRRTNLKGATKDISHKLDLDYSIHEYSISKKLAESIKEYQDLVRKNGESEFLLSIKLHSFLTGKQHYYKSTNFGTKHLRTLLDWFYQKIIYEKFGITLYSKNHFSQKDDVRIFTEEEKLLEPNEIMMHQLGDTRHFSMVNLVLNDFNPILIKDFAGHDDINTSYHYFNHIGKIVKCMTYYKYQQLKKGVINLNDEFSLINQVNLESIARGLNNKAKTKFKEVDLGRCYSEKFIAGDISDCMQIEGDCLNCGHIALKKGYRDEGIKKRRQEIEKRLDEEGVFLANILSSYNETNDEFAEFQRRILNIQHAANEYSRITKKLLEGVANDQSK